MKDQFESTFGFGMKKLVFNKILYSCRSENVKWCSFSHQLHGRNETDKPENMITVKMRNENMADPGKFGFCSSQLHLSSFTAVDQQITFIHIDQLCGWV